MKRSANSKIRNRSLVSQNQVIDAVVALIGERGFSSCSTANIAERAGVSWGVLQYQFGGKQQIFEAVLMRNFLELEKTLQELEQSEATSTEKLRTAMDTIWDYYSRPAYRASMEILLNVSHEADSFARLARKARNGLSDCLKSIFKQCNASMERGLADEIAELVLASLRGFAMGNVLVSTRKLSYRAHRNLLEALIMAKILQ